MAKASPSVLVGLPEPEVVSQEGTLWMKTNTHVFVLNAIGDFRSLEYKPGSVQSKWVEGIQVRVFHTDEFRSKVVTMEEIRPEPLAEPDSGGCHDGSKEA